LKVALCDNWWMLYWRILTNISKLSLHFIANLYRIKHKPYPIPKIQDLILKLEGFHYATSLDQNTGYCHIELSPFLNNCAQSCSLLKNMNTNVYQWDYVIPLTFFKK
jgi:hypothetical protein